MEFRVIQLDNAEDQLNGLGSDGWTYLFHWTTAGTREGWAGEHMHTYVTVVMQRPIAKEAPTPFAMKV